MARRRRTLKKFIREAVEQIKEQQQFKTQQQVAEYIGISAPTLSNWMNPESHDVLIENLDVLLDKLHPGTELGDYLKFPEEQPPELEELLRKLALSKEKTGTNGPP